MSFEIAVHLQPPPHGLQHTNLDCACFQSEDTLHFMIYLLSPFLSPLLTDIFKVPTVLTNTYEYLLFCSTKFVCHMGMHPHSTTSMAGSRLSYQGAAIDAVHSWDDVRTTALTSQPKAMQAFRAGSAVCSSWLCLYAAYQARHVLQVESTVTGSDGSATSQPIQNQMYVVQQG